MAELERLHSHLLRAGVATELIGFETLFLHAFRMREQVMDSLETISGNRVNYSMNRIGGVNRDIGDPDAVLFSVRSIRDDVLRSLIPIFTSDQTVAARCDGSECSRVRMRLSTGQWVPSRALPELTAIYAAISRSGSWMY